MPVPVVKADPSKVQLARAAHVYYSHPDLATFERFASNFGLVEAARDADRIYYRGYGRDPYVYVASQSKSGAPEFMGTAFVAQTQNDFEKASRIEGAYRTDISHAPGGGQMVTIPRPNGTFIHVVWGQEERQIDETTKATTATHQSQGPYNTAFDKQRRGKFQRYNPGPALVHKLGHYGYVCKEFDEEIAFYTSNFNFQYSDVRWSPEDPSQDVIAFMHLDLGKEYSDHHIFFLARAPPEAPRTTVHHSSFEIADFDTQLLGHDWLAKHGWKSVWGVGRHIDGSQIFDYWYDSDGFKVEHYCDGDVVNEDNEVRKGESGPLSIWGPEIPNDFFLDQVKASA